MAGKPSAASAFGHTANFKTSRTNDAVKSSRSSQAGSLQITSLHGMNSCQEIRPEVKNANHSSISFGALGLGAVASCAASRDLDSSQRMQKLRRIACVRNRAPRQFWSSLPCFSRAKSLFPPWPEEMKPWARGAAKNWQRMFVLTSH